MHELAANAAKYGALATSGGELEISWTREGENAVLAWRERSERPVAAPAKLGFGTRLIARLAEGDLRGSAVFDYAPDGLQVLVRFAAE